jgi:predicted acyltransferase
MNRPATSPHRIESIDQLRGYAIFGMILVNVLGHFHVMPETFRHHPQSYSYADTIAPLFIFVVGIGFRISLPRRIAIDGPRRARLHAIRRYALLALLGCLYGGFDFRVSVWDALLDIALAGLLALPFLEKSAPIRIAAATAYLTLSPACYSLLGYGPWVMANSIDGGPLGPLSWVFILLLGTIAWDLAAQNTPRRYLIALLLLSLLFIALGWTLKIEWTGLKPEWPFSQKGMSAPYTLYSTGLAFLALLAAHLLCDRLHLRLPLLTLLGMNPLVMYLLQALLGTLARELLPPNAPWHLALTAFLTVFTACYATAWLLHRRGILIKL